MRILYAVHQFFPKNHTGTERFTLDLARQIQRMGHSPTVLTYERDPAEEGFVRLEDSVEVKRYDYLGIPVISLRDNSAEDQVQAISHGREQIFHSGIEKAFRKLRLKFDLLHICHPLWLSSVAWTSKNHGVPIVLTLTDPWLLCPRETLLDCESRLCNGPESGRRCISHCSYPAGVIERYRDAFRLLEMADEVVTSSHFTASLFRSNGWSGNIRIVPHSVDYRFVKMNSQRDINHRTVAFGYIGTIGWHKGLHVIVKAFRKISSRNVRLRVHGSIHHNPEYSKDVLSLAQGDERIQFLGTFALEELFDVMRNISVLVVPSVYYENYPLIMLMALAYKVPVVASNIGGMPEVIRHETNGMLFEAGNSDELALLIDQMARDPEIIQRLAENIIPPRRIEEEALDYENIYMRLTSI